MDSRKYKILLVQPSQYGKGTICRQSRIHLPGLALPHLAALTPPHWDVECIYEVIEQVPLDTDADIVGIGTMGHSIYRGLDLAAEFRRRGKAVVMGGYMASMAITHLEGRVDSVIVGDAERSYPVMLSDFERTGRLRPAYDMPVSDLAGLPVPRYDLLTAKPIGSMLPVQAGRGCPHACTFCSIACLYRGRYMKRPMDDVIRDIHAVRALGFRRFYLIDDNIAADAEYLSSLCDRIAPMGMTWASQCSISLARNPSLLAKVYRSGARILSFGLESITQEGLDRLGKSWVRVDQHAESLRRVSESGILPSTEMVLGTDSDTEESIRATLDFVNRARIPIPRFYILTPMPGTEFFTQCRKSGKLLTDDFRRYNGAECVHRPERIAPDRVTSLYWWLNREVFSMKSILRRTLLNPTSYAGRSMNLFAFVVNMHYRKYVRNGIVPNIF